MQYLPLENVDKKASRLVFGTGTAKVTGNDREAAFACLDTAFAAGITIFDTAHSYGNAETHLGQWMQARGNREQVIVLDKGCNPGQRGSEDQMTPDCIRKQLDTSLQRLHTEYTDLYILHRDDLSVPVGPIVETLNELKVAGKIRRFGGSNWKRSRIQEANEYAKLHGLEGFTAVSPCYSLTEQLGDPWGGSVCLAGEAGKEDREWYRLQKMPVFAYSALARGFLSGRYRTDGQRPIEDCLSLAPIQEYYYPVNVARLRRAEQLAQQKGRSVAQICLAWLLNQPLAVYPIISPSTPDHLAENAEALELTLTKEDCDYLEKGPIQQ